jgi:hypothetical protein
LSSPIKEALRRKRQEFNQERAVKGFSRFMEPIGRPMTSSIGRIAPFSVFILTQNRFWNYSSCFELSVRTAEWE